MDNPLVIAGVAALLIGALAFKPLVFIFRALKEMLFTATDPAQKQHEVAQLKEIARIEQLPEEEAEREATVLFAKYGAEKPAFAEWNAMGFSSKLLSDFFNQYSTLSFEIGDQTIDASLLRQVFINNELFVIIGCESSEEFYYGIRNSDAAVFALRIDENQNTFSGMAGEDIDNYAGSVAKYVLFQYALRSP